MSIDNIIEEYYDQIFHYIRKQVNDTETAKDLVQEVFMKVCNNYHRYDPKKASELTWIYSITYNHLKNYYKKAKYSTMVRLSEIETNRLQSSEDIIEEVLRQEDITFFITMMNRKLNKKHAKIMNLYFFTKYTRKEISYILNLPQKTVYNTITISIKKLRKEMEEYINERV